MEGGVEDFNRNGSSSSFVVVTKSCMKCSKGKNQTNEQNSLGRDTRFYSYIIPRQWDDARPISPTRHQSPVYSFSIVRDKSPLNGVPTLFFFTWIFIVGDESTWSPPSLRLSISHTVLKHPVPILIRWPLSITFFPKSFQNFLLTVYRCAYGCLSVDTKKGLDFQGRLDLSD